MVWDFCSCCLFLFLFVCLLWFEGAFMLPGVFWASWNMFQCQTLIWGKLSVITVSNIFLFFSFFSFWDSHYLYVTLFVVFPQSLDILVLLFVSLVLVSLLFGFRRFYWYILYLRFFPYSLFPTKENFCNMFFNLSHFFLVLRISICCLYCLFVLAYCVLFSSRALSILIIV